MSLVACIGTADKSCHPHLRERCGIAHEQDFMSLHGCITNLWRSIGQAVRSLGVADGLLYLASRVFERISFGTIRLLRYRFIAQPIGYSAATVMRADSATIVLPTPPESPLVAAFPRPPQVLRRRYEGGAECFAAMVRTAFAGFIWFQRVAYEEDEVRCRYVLAAPERCVWDFDVYVEPRFRFGRTLARLWHAVDTHLAKQGIQWSFSRISAFNANSIAAHTRLGIVDCGSATFLCVGALQIAVLSTPPFMHLSFSSRHRPSIRLSPPR